ncbi:hypothetical protein EG856_00770 [Mycoplasmopsis phocirhinis]|uniref:DUF31 domain-containing protein n=1 Tax=Mycoplasmopsis phocirhinis TaxID=142650 RepID=A0A4V0ZAE9_9BACT|nr:hypothetical protein [Mycoplasmopsis phocirhinis]QBF34462.1 hypothetical protein EG856_00770 [Mycoplasmopsis phocirhinis]
MKKIKKKLLGFSLLVANSIILSACSPTKNKKMQDKEIENSDPKQSNQQNKHESTQIETIKKKKEDNNSISKIEPSESDTQNKPINPDQDKSIPNDQKLTPNKTNEITTENSTKKQPNEQSSNTNNSTQNKQKFTPNQTNQNKNDNQVQNKTDKQSSSPDSTDFDALPQYELNFQNSLIESEQDVFQLKFSTSLSEDLYLKVLLKDVENNNLTFESNIVNLKTQILDFNSLNSSKSYVISNIDIYTDDKGLNKYTKSLTYNQKNIFDIKKQANNSESNTQIQTKYAAVNSVHNPIPLVSQIQVDEVLNTDFNIEKIKQIQPNNIYFDNLVNNNVDVLKQNTYATILNTNQNLELFIANSQDKDFYVLKDGQKFFAKSKKYNHYVFESIQGNFELFNEDNQKVDIYTRAQNEININSTNVQNNILNINWQNTQNTNNNIKIMVKSLDVTNPYITILNSTNLTTNGANFNIEHLPKNYNKFLISNIFIDNNVYSYKQSDQSRIFETLNLNKSLNLSFLQFYLDNENKNVYGSALFDFNSNDIEYYKNMVFDFSFERKVENLNPDYVKSVRQNRKISVPFENLWKFNLNNLAEFSEYSLTKIDVATKQSSIPISKVNLANYANKKISYHFNYDQYDQINFLANGLNNNNLQTDQNTNRYKIREQWINRNQYSSNKNIDFSLNNLWAISQHLLDYEKNIIEYKDNDANLYEHRIKRLNSEEYENLRIYAPRELIKNKQFEFNKNKDKITLTKKLNAFKNLNQLNEDSSILFFKFELSIHDRVNFDLFDFRSVASEIVVPVSLKMLKQNSRHENLNFHYYELFSDQFVQEHNYNKIRNNFDFALNYDAVTQKVSLEIKAKNEYKFTNLISEHNTSSTKTIFVSPAIFGFIYLQKELNLEYNEQKLDNLSEIVPEFSVYNIDNYIYAKKYNDFRETPFIFKDQIETKSAKRLFKEDNSIGINTARQRSFRAGFGTWNLLGKVKPNDDNDFEFWIATNDHVATGSNNLDLTRTGPLHEIMVPKLINKGPKGQAQKSPHRAESDFYKWANADFEMRYREYKNFNPNDVILSTEGEKITSNNKNFDLSIGTVDLKNLFQKYGNGKLESFNLDETKKAVIQFFLNWIKVPFIKLSNDSKFFADNSALNWYIASFPADKTNNKDFILGSRYREYLLMYSSAFTNAKNYSNQFASTQVSFDRRAADLSGGSSGTFVYDYKGDVVGVLSEGQNTIDGHGLNGIHLFDGQVRTIFGSKDDKKNQQSFYWKVKTDSYLMPEYFVDPFDEA